MAPVKNRAEAAAVAAYKGVLKRVVDNRPSGTRHRLAVALGKNRSFISQITSPAYSVPIPAAHLETIFEVCHFTPTEKTEFLAAYTVAHKRQLRLGRKATGHRTLTISLPDLGDAAKNRRLDEAIVEIVHRLVRLTEEE